MRERMTAVGVLVGQHEPDVVCCQEGTENIAALVKAQDWAKRCVVPPHPTSQPSTTLPAPATPCSGASAEFIRSGG
jgi:hypothetical protein